MAGAARIAGAGIERIEFQVEAWAAQDFTQLSLEELMMVEVSTV